MNESIFISLKDYWILLPPPFRFQEMNNLGDTRMPVAIEVSRFPLYWNEVVGSRFS